MVLAPQEIRTFFVTSVTEGRRALVQSVRMATLLIDVMRENRRRQRFSIHEFVIMPNHFHLLITPAERVSLEKAIQVHQGWIFFSRKKGT